jgi:regulator of protease activity HflC (stomatin/prohibitin superfamily)
MADGIVEDGGTGLPETGFSEAGLADQNVLGHLLKIEGEAAALVDDAQAEADRRVAEAEKQNRSRYDEEYSRQAGELDAAYGQEINQVRADYQDRIESYRKSLEAIATDQGRFSTLLDDLLVMPSGGR